jgi:hypothetical protein
MTTVQIELPDEQAAALRAKLSARGLSLEGWFRQIAEAEALTRAPFSAPEAVARIFELQKHVKPDPEGWTVKDYIRYGRP